MQSIFLIVGIILVNALSYSALILAPNNYEFDLCLSPSSRRGGGKTSILASPLQQNKMIKLPKLLASTNILGENVILCRSFTIDSPKKFDFIGSFTDVSHIPICSAPEIALVGRSNVGKSSFINCLTGMHKKIAIEGKTPGRTQQINLFRCSDQIGDLCIFVDLPGYGYAKISKTKQNEISHFLRKYLQEREALKLVILLIDPRRDLQDADLEMAKVCAVW